MMRNWSAFGLASAALITALALASIPANAQPKPDAPRVVCSLPIGLPVGTATRFTARGLGLDKATEVRFHEPKTFGSIKTRGPAQVPNPQELPRTGNTQAEVEVKLNADLGGRFVPFSFAGPAGQGGAQNLFVLDEHTQVIPEKEPNNGFREAQLLTAPAGTMLAVQGLIAQPHDVDVFRVEGRAGQLLRAEVIARRCGAALDSLLTLYSETGEEVAANDDHAGSADSLLAVRLPANGVYFLSLIDALDTGGPTHGYCLLLSLEP